jgi:hypothetical protein
VKETVSSGAQSAGSAVSSFASRAKTPLIAGGAALAGLAAGAVLTDRTGKRRNFLNGISLPRPNGRLRKGINVDPEAIASAAKRVGTFGQQVSRVATEVQKARDEVKKSG